MEGQIQDLTAIVGHPNAACDARLVDPGAVLGLDAVQARVSRMKRLTELGHLITSSLERARILDLVTDAALDLLKGDLARLWVVDEAAAVLRLAASRARQGDTAPSNTSAEFPLGQGLVGWVVAHRSRRYSANLLEDPLQVNREWVRAGGYVSQIAVPLILRDRVLGALVVVTKALREFSREDEELLDLLATTTATALENARLFAATEAQAGALKEKNAQLDSFVYSVSHDLKAPLIAIQGMASVLIDEYGPKLGAEGQHYLHRINANIQQMDRLIGDLLTLSRVGREARPPEPVSLAELVDDLLVELAEPIRTRGITVIGWNLGTVWAVRSQIQQVIGNLVSNAIKYIGDAAEPTVEIGTVDDGEFVHCYVKDNGIGIDPAHHERVFEVFQRLHEVEAGGTGVGLAIVRKIVEAAGGRIWVESAKGQGATFHFTWPKGPREPGGGPPRHPHAFGVDARVPAPSGPPPEEPARAKPALGVEPAMAGELPGAREHSTLLLRQGPRTGGHGSA
ncbi:MAG: GAF domain-containing protein [Candidatus Rokubacteria bacterium]|nr:GAF domain-containing protein [Candidatus Rokubacteria bacterium]